MKFFLFISVALVTATGLAQVRIDGNTRADILSIQNQFELEKSVSEEMMNNYPIHKIGAEYYVGFLAKTNSSFLESELENFGMYASSKIRDIISLKVPINKLDHMIDLIGLDFIQIAAKIKPYLDRAHWDVNIDSVWLGIGLPQGYTGKNVLIGITDWGFDYSHPNFYDTSLTQTRILAAWDQFKTSGPAPSGYNYGTEYSNPAEFELAGSDTANIYSYATHGSHVAGIAGGCGAGTIYRGMAFEAQYLFTTFLVDESAVLDAWQWMYEKAEAENKRLVVNMSWGLYYMGPNDGTSLLSQALDSYSDLDVLFVTSAGNNGDVNFHLKHDFTNDTIQTKIEFYNSTMPTLWGQSIHAWGEPGNNFSIGLVVYDNSGNLLGESDTYFTNTLMNYVDTFFVIAADTFWYNISADSAYPTNNRPQVRLRVKKNTSGLKVGIRASAAAGRVHFWNLTELSNDVGNWGMPFNSLFSGSQSGDKYYGIGAPACTQTVISVAAHASRYQLGPNWIGGQSAPFSSFGPLINEDIKPDISAPGSAVASSISSFTDNSYTPIATINFNGSNYPYARFSGTSMSSPCVAGISAVLLEANPYLSPEQIKFIIQETAVEDQFTGVIPPEGSIKWGQGKINAYAAVQLALNTISVSEFLDDLEWKVFPNPSKDLISLTNVNKDLVSSAKIIDMFGNEVMNIDSFEDIDISVLKRGTYFLRLIRENHVEQQKFIKQ